MVLCSANLFVHHYVLAEGNVYDSYQQDPHEKQNDPSNINIEETEEQSFEMEEDIFDTTDQSKTTFLLILEIVFYLFIVLVMIYGLIKFLAVRQRKIGHHRLFQTLGGTPLGNNKSLQLVKVGGKYYLLGVADQVSLIKEITDTNELSIIERDIEEQESVISKGLTNLLAKKSRVNEQGGSTQSFQNMFEKSLHHHKSKREVFENNGDPQTENNKEGRST